MRAKVTADLHGDYYGLHLSPGLEFDVPEALEWRILHNPSLFSVIEELKKPGRKPRVSDGDPA